MKKSAVPRFVKTSADRVPEPKKVEAKLNSAKLEEELLRLGISSSKNLRVFDIPVDLISPDELNPNEMNDKTFNRLVQEIEETGFIDPILIVPSEGGRFSLIDGEQRWMAMRTLGHERIPSVILETEDEDLKKFLLIRKGNLRGETNKDKLLKLIQDVSKRYGEKQLQFLCAYTDEDAWNKLTKGVERSLAQAGILSAEEMSEAKERMSRTKSVDGLGRILKKIFSEHGSDLEHGFIAFTYGGKVNYFIQMTDSVEKIMGKLVAECRSSKKNINEVFEEVLRIKDAD